MYGHEHTKITYCLLLVICGARVNLQVGDNRYSLDSRVVANGLPGLVLCSISKYVTMGCSRIFEVLHVHVQPILCIPY